MPLFYSGGLVHALPPTYGEVEPRSITMSNSEGGTTGGTAVSYAVNYTAATTGTVKEIVVDFCTFDPLWGDTCNQPAGLTMGATPSVTTSGAMGASGWSAAAQASSPYTTLFLTDAPPA